MDINRDMTNEELIQIRKGHKPSNGEKEVAKFLRQNKIRFQAEYYHSTLINEKKANLFIDFYIPSLKIAIEYDGAGHYSNIFGKVAYAKTRRHDNIKNIWCRRHGIKMLRITAWRREDIQSKLIKALF